MTNKYVIQCEGCGDDVVIKRGGDRLCDPCQAVARRARKAAPKVVPVKVEIVRVCDECQGSKLNPRTPDGRCFSCG